MLAVVGQGADELREGALLGGRYRIVRALGKGGMGAVYEGVHEELQRRVAVKVLHGMLSGDQIQLERFRREAETAAALGHPNIVPVTDFGVEAGRAFLVMELIEGRTLFEIVRDDGPLSQARAAAIGIQVLSALEAVHSAGVVHRDLKPSNVMVTTVAGLHEHARLLDFGVAKMREGPGYARLTATGLIVGTPTYMAPEQVVGRAVDGRTDLYAAGALLYAALVKRPPIAVGPLGEQVQRILDTEPMPLASLRADLEPRFCAVIMRALAKLPNDRWANAGEMADALRPFATGATQASRPSDSEPAATVSARPRAPATVPERASARARPASPSAPSVPPAEPPSQMHPSSPQLPASAFASPLPTGPEQWKRRQRAPFFLGGGILAAAILFAVLAFVAVAYYFLSFWADVHRMTGH